MTGELIILLLLVCLTLLIGILRILYFLHD